MAAAVAPVDAAAVFAKARRRLIPFPSLMSIVAPISGVLRPFVRQDV